MIDLIQEDERELGEWATALDYAEERGRELSGGWMYALDPRHWKSPLYRTAVMRQYRKKAQERILSILMQGGRFVVEITEEYPEPDSTEPEKTYTLRLHIVPIIERREIEDPPPTILKARKARISECRACGCEACELALKKLLSF